MSIQKFVRHNYRKVDAYTDVQLVRGHLSTGEAIVVQEQENLIGILSSQDIVARPYRLVVDCLEDKPRVFLQQTAEEVLHVMEENKTDALLAYHQEQCVGIVYKKDIFRHLQHSLEEQTDFTLSIVHDLRNYVSNISSIAEILKGQIKKKKTLELLSHAAGACNSSLNLLQELLYLAQLENKGENHTTEPVDVHTLITECIGLIATAAEKKHIRIQHETVPAKYYVLGETAALKRVFHNILSNAVKFTKSNGSVAVKIEGRESSVVISVQDTGIGIPEQMQAKIFNKLTKARRRGTDGESSTGLGMFITKQIIERHNGKIWLKSKEKNGTTFFVELGRVTISALNGRGI